MAETAAGALPQPVQGRECGTCTLCCKVLAIDELNKPRGVWCPHCKPGWGCTIYEERPPPCRTFHCMYLVSERVPEEWRPTRSKIVLVSDGGSTAAIVDPGFPDAWKVEPYYGQLKAWAAAGISIRRAVLVRIGKRTIAVLPDRDVELGDVEPDANIVIEGRSTPFGMEYSARRASKA